MITPVIMAGGSGTRLWPLSRSGHPKQFLALNGDKTMLQQTIERLSDLPAAESIIICNEKHRFFVAEQLREIDTLGKIILEPVGRNTAPAIALRALAEKETTPLLLVLAADHVIADQGTHSLKLYHLPRTGKLVTFGSSTRAHTGYGYIEAGEHRLALILLPRFKEKPDPETAAQVLTHGGYYWNSGMFFLRRVATSSELEDPQA
jgi:mannose-1-phosphate guanylyltransferase